MTQLSVAALLYEFHVMAKAWRSACMGSGKEHFLYTSERCSWIVPSQSPDVSCMTYSAEL